MDVTVRQRETGLAVLLTALAVAGLLPFAVVLAELLYRAAIEVVRTRDLRWLFDASSSSTPPPKPSPLVGVACPVCGLARCGMLLSPAEPRDVDSSSAVSRE